MKKCFFYAGALAMLLSSCSNDDVATGPVLNAGQGGVVKDLKISLASSVLGVTKSTGSADSKLHDVYVFVRADVDGPDAQGAYEYKYDFKKLSAGKTTTTVEWAESNSMVYVVANNAGMTDVIAKRLCDDANAAHAGQEGRVFQNEVLEVSKSYIADLNDTDGQFIMSGRATVPTVSGNGATVMSVPVNRDLAKVAFSVSKNATDGENQGSLRIKEVKEITVRRVANRVKPFALSGTNPTTYSLPYGFGDARYKQDGLTNGVFAPDNNNASANDVTDYSFAYQWANEQTGDLYNFRDFYVLPNAAPSVDKGTIIVLKAVVEEKGATDWAEVPGDNDASGNPTKERYLKARVSTGIDEFLTAKNTQYVITARIKGKGNGSGSGDSGPDVEDTDNDLNITVDVQPWNVIVSDQSME